jgi:hypothetical protein
MLPLEQVRGVSCCFVVLVFASIALGSSQAPSTLPAKLETYLTNVVRLPAGERRRLMQGEPVARLLDTDGSKEVAVFGAIWVDAPPARYVEAVSDIERFEQGRSFRITRRIASPPRIEDFAELRLPDEDLRDLRTCRVGNCDVKLGEQALRRFRTEVDWNASDAHAVANALMRKVAHEYVAGYLEGGNDRLAVYRDGSRPTFVSQEFRAMTNEMPELTTYMPNVRRYLLEYPRATLPGATSMFYWQETNFGLKPTIRISHMTILPTAEETIVASKMLYATHYFLTGLELRVLIPDKARGSGFWFVNVNRSRSDGLSGFTGLFVRRHVQSGVREGTLTSLRSTKQRLERHR